MAATVQVDAKNSMPGPPQVGGGSIFQGIKEGMSIYTLHYRARFAPVQGHFLAADMQDAKNKGSDYCRRWGLRYISVVPFFLNMEENPDPREQRVASDLAAAEKRDAIIR